MVPGELVFFFGFSAQQTVGFFYFVPSIDGPMEGNKTFSAAAEAGAVSFLFGVVFCLFTTLFVVFGVHDFDTAAH